MKIILLLLRNIVPIMMLTVILIALLSGCASTQCVSNPRSMSCMSSDQLVRELARPIP